MPYDIRRRVAKQWSTHMVEEEADVWNAMNESGYKFMAFVVPDTEGAPKIWDFVSSADLYDEYIKYRRTRRCPPDEDLNPTQFGVALNAVMEFTLVRARPTIIVDGKKKRVWGFRAVTGPKSQIVKTRAGRPPTV